MNKVIADLKVIRRMNQTNDLSYLCPLYALCRLLASKVISVKVI